MSLLDSTREHKLLILVIANHSEKTMQWILNRIPESVFSIYDAHILVVNDTSVDVSIGKACEYQRGRRCIPLTYVNNLHNHGYGGDLKIGYMFAIKEGFDYLATLHGSGRYVPEELDRLLKPLNEGCIDAVFGSRMMTTFGALKGGMPLFEYVWNRFLTIMQNLMLGTSLSEFHSGYRLYSTRILKQIPFMLNANDFHFDTEIIIQLVNARAVIIELPVPTYYRDELRSVSGFKYAANIIVSTLKNVLHRCGILYQRRYDTESGSVTLYGLKLGYKSSHTMAIDAVPAGSSVIDIGGGQGWLAEYLSREKGCAVGMVDQFDVKEKREGITYVTQSLDEKPGFSVTEYDYILLLDVIEHLKNPELFLAQLREQFVFKPKTIVLTTPNVAFIIQRLMLILGQFNYGKRGILDLTHRRLFTFRGLKYLLRDSGLKIIRMDGIPAPFPKAIGDNSLSRLLLKINQALIRVSPELFSYQIFVETETTPDINYILKHVCE